MFFLPLNSFQFIFQVVQGNYIMDKPIVENAIVKKTKRKAYVLSLKMRDIIDSFTLFDNEFMSVFFDNNCEAAQFVLNKILACEDIIVKEVHPQKYAKSSLKAGRSIVLDVFAIDKDGKHYNIEIQRADSGASCKRARFHSAVIDSRMLKAGEDFTKMNDSYVIFITEHDVMGKGLPVYHVERVIKELEKDFNDGNHIIYVNGSYKDENSEIGLLMKDFSCSRAEDMHYDILKKSMYHYKNTEEGRKIMCEKVQKYGDEREKFGRLKGRLEGKLEGKLEGQEEGKSEARIENAKSMIADKLPLEKVAAYSGLPLSKVRELAG